MKNCQSTSLKALSLSTPLAAPIALGTKTDVTPKVCLKVLLKAPSLSPSLSLFLNFLLSPFFANTELVKNRKEVWLERFTWLRQSVRKWLCDDVCLCVSTFLNVVSLRFKEGISPLQHTQCCFYRTKYTQGWCIETKDPPPTACCCSLLCYLIHNSMLLKIPNTNQKVLIVYTWLNN